MFVFIVKLKIKVVEIKNETTLKFEDFNIGVFKLNHGCPCLGYRFVEKDKIRIDKKKLKKFGIKPGPKIGLLKKGKSIKAGSRIIKAKDVSYIEKGKRIGIVLDTRLCPNVYKIAKDVDLLICESSYLHEIKDIAYEYKHLTNEQAASIAKKARAKKLILTHVSQRHEYEDKKIFEGAKKIFRNTILAEDLMRMSV